jgi:hypothetical protein
VASLKASAVRSGILNKASERFWSLGGTGREAWNGSRRLIQDKSEWIVSRSRQIDRTKKVGCGGLGVAAAVPAQSQKICGRGDPPSVSQPGSFRRIVRHRVVGHMSVPRKIKFSGLKAY